MRGGEGVGDRGEAVGDRREAVGDRGKPLETGGSRWGGGLGAEVRVPEGTSKVAQQIASRAQESSGKSRTENPTLELPYTHIITPPHTQACTTCCPCWRAA